MKYVETVKFYRMLVALDNLIQYFIFTFSIIKLQLKYTGFQESSSSLLPHYFLSLFSSPSTPLS